METEITTPFEALVRGLALAITAPTDTQAAECVEVAEKFATGFTGQEVERPTHWRSLKWSNGK